MPQCYCEFRIEASKIIFLQTCISRYPCASKVKLDKMFGVLCDAFSYLSTDFAPCQKKIEAQNPPCIKKAEKIFSDPEMVDQDNEPIAITCVFQMKKPCDLITANKSCIQNEITDICGESYWLPVNKIFKRMERYSILNCEKQKNEVVFDESIF